MSAIGCIPENHDWCLEQLLKSCSEIYAPFEDFPNAFYPIKELINVMSEEFARLRFICFPASSDLEAYLFICASQFAEHQAYGSAFAVSVLGFSNSTSKSINFGETIAWREKVAEDVEKYNSEMKVFEPLMKKLYKRDFDKSLFYFLEMLHNNMISVYFAGKEKFEETFDYRFHHLHKRFELNVLPNGVTPYLFKLLENCLSFLNIQRFKQARHILAVVSELMKSVNQDTGVFKKLQEFFFMVKTMYWAMILAKSELKGAVQKIPGASDKVTVKERVIRFNIPLPDGEDLDLPTELIETEAGRAPIYEKLRTYQRVLKRSTLPHVARIYNSVLICDINYYDANTSTPFCCGKHECRHPHN